MYIYVPFHVASGLNPLQHRQGAPLPGHADGGAERDLHQGKVYQSASGGIAPAILADAIKTVWAPCFVGRCADKVVGVLCDAYGHHWDVEVLKAMKGDFFCAIIRAPNATGLSQIADMHNNGVLKIKWVQARSILMDRKQADHALPAEAHRVTGPGEGKLVPGRVQWPTETAPMHRL